MQRGAGLLPLRVRRVLRSARRAHARLASRVVRHASRFAHCTRGAPRAAHAAGRAPHAEHPDLHGFRRNEHRAVLLDEVATPSFITNNKKLLQAHVDGAILGQSPTQSYTYEVFLWRVPIILTTNNWRLEKLTDEDREWLSSNCVAVHVSEPVFKRARV